MKYFIEGVIIMNDFYNKNAKVFIENTFNVDMSEQYKFLEKHIPKTGKILDIGFGSGRDSLYFSNNYEVVSIDNSEVFIEEGKKILKNKILLMDVRDMTFSEEFDAIWACASLLHIPFNELPYVLDKCYRALKKDGVMYMSFKYGTFEGIRNGRYFTDLDEDKLKKIVELTKFTIKDLKITKDVRPDRDEKWLNIILFK